MAGQQTTNQTAQANATAMPAPATTSTPATASATPVQSTAPVGQPKQPLQVGSIQKATETGRSQTASAIPSTTGAVGKPMAEKPVVPEGEKKSLLWLWIILAVVLLIGAGVGIWFWLK